MFFSALYLVHPSSILFYSSFSSLFCFLPLFIHFIFGSPLLFSFQICYPFFSLFLLLCSVCFSLMLYYYSICSLSISLHLFRSLYHNDTSCSVFFLSFSLFSFPLSLSVLFMLSFCFCFYSFSFSVLFFPLF